MQKAKEQSFKNAQRAGDDDVVDVDVVDDVGDVDGDDDVDDVYGDD